MDAWGLTSSDLVFQERAPAQVAGFEASNRRILARSARQNTIHGGLMVTIQWMMLERLQYVQNMIKSFYYIARRSVQLSLYAGRSDLIRYLPDLKGVGNRDLMGETRQQMKRNYYNGLGWFAMKRIP